MRIDGIGAIAARQMMAVLDNAASVDRLTTRMLRGSNDAAQVQSAQGTAPAEAAPAQMAATPQALGNVQMVVTASTLNPVEQRRRVAVAKAKSGLDALGRLQAEMLSGQARAGTLAALRSWLEDRPETDDPRFAQFFADIELRVRVELAKFDVEL